MNFKAAYHIADDCVNTTYKGGDACSFPNLTDSKVPDRFSSIENVYCKLAGRPTIIVHPF